MKGAAFTWNLPEKGDLVINPMVNMDSGFAEGEAIADLTYWARENGGRVPSSRAIVRLPDGARCEPDLSWLSPEQLAELGPIRSDRAIALCPAFVAEIMSSSDRLPPLQRKMERYIANGALLGWLIDPYHRRVYRYRPGLPVETLEDPETISGDPVLPGFVFAVRQRIFRPARRIDIMVTTAMPVPKPAPPLPASAPAADAAADMDDFVLPHPVSVNIRPILESVAGLLTDDEIDQRFVELHQANEEYGVSLELTAEGELVISPMVNRKGSYAELEMGAELVIWSREHGGEAHGANANMRLPDGSRIRPDALWLSPAQVAALPPVADDKPITVCPVFCRGDSIRH